MTSYLLLRASSELKIAIDVYVVFFENLIFKFLWNLFATARMESIYIITLYISIGCVWCRYLEMHLQIIIWRTTSKYVVH